VRIKNMNGKFNTYLRESFESLLRTKNFILISAALFIFGAALGFFVYQLSPDNEFFSLILNELEKIGGGLGEKSAVENIVFLFIHNLEAILFSMASGVFLFFPVLFILINGATIGFFFGAANNPALFIAIIPHGIFEIPSFLIGTGVGIRLGFVIIMPKKGKTRIECLREVSSDAVKILILIIPMLLIAAAVEITISAELAKMLV